VRNEKDEHNFLGWKLPLEHELIRRNINFLHLDVVLAQKEAKKTIQFITQKWEGLSEASLAIFC
jgi:hypothetical protein